MLNPYEEAEAWTEYNRNEVAYQLKEEELDFQNLQITYRHELMQIPEAEGLKEFLTGVTEHD